MKKKIQIILVVFIVTLGCMQFGCSLEKDKKSIDVGVILPLTGKFSFYGNEVKDALTIVEKNAKSKSVNFIFEDNQSESGKSVTIFNKFAIRENMPLIISCNSPLSIPLRPLAEKNSKVLLALVTGARNFGEANKWCFRDAINQDQEGVALAKYIIANTSKRKGATFVVNDDYGLGGAQSFVEKFEELGGNISSQETFAMDGRNMRNDVSKLLKNNPDFIFLVGREQTIISSINQIREQNESILIVTSDSFDSPNVLTSLGSNTQGVVYANYNNNLETKNGKILFSEFNTLFSREPGIYAIDSYIAGKYIIQLLEKSDNNSAILQEEFSKMIYDSQIKGELKVNSLRDVISPVAIFKINSELEKEILHIVK